MTLKAEQACQINAINWLRHAHPEIEKNTFHLANERKCSIQTGRLLKRMGVKRGISDLFIPVPRHGKSGLWLEIKVGANQPTKEQQEFLQLQLKNNFACACCWELEAIKKVVTNYLSDCAIQHYFDEVIYEKTV